MKEPPATLSGRGDRFASTHWSVVLSAGQRPSPESDVALDKLCRAYWPPLYAYARRRVSDLHDAQDLTQAFFEELLEKRYVADADPERGRFRAFLITAFKHFLAREREKARAQKRGGGRRTFSFDFAAHEAVSDELADGLTPDRIYGQQWALTLLERVMSRLQREMERDGKHVQFQSLKGFLGGASNSSYAAPAAELGISEPAARMAASRMRARYRDLLRDEIAQTVRSTDEIDDEVRFLFSTFEN